MRWGKDDAFISYIAIRWTGAGAGEYDRSRSGFGNTYRRDRYLGAFEYSSADGMIFNGTDGGAIPGTVATAGAGALGIVLGHQGGRFVGDPGATARHRRHRLHRRRRNLQAVHRRS